MDSELVSSSLSATDGGGHNSSLPNFTYTERFYEMFPYYLSIGMTPEQYWESDCTLTKYYRKAEELRNEKRNQELWLQGMYVYEAIADVSPVLHAFAKRVLNPFLIRRNLMLLVRNRSGKSERKRNARLRKRVRDL